MDIGQAVKALRDCRRVCRGEWPGETAIDLRGNRLVCTGNPNWPNAHTYELTTADVLASDWEVL